MLGVSSSARPQPADRVDGQASQADAEPSRRSLVLLHRELDDEAGPGLAVGPVLDPHPPAVEVDVLGDEGQAQADALAAAPATGALAAVKRSKISARSSSGTPCPRSSTAICTPSPAWRSETLVAPSPYLPALSSRLAITRTMRRLSALHHHAGQLGVELHGDVGVGRVADRLHHQLGQVHLLELEAGHTGVEAGDLQQVLHELLEAVDVADHQVEGGPGPLGISSRWFSMTSIDAASVMSGERSSWLTSDAKRASRSIRSWRAWAISLNEAVIGRRSGSSLARAGGRAARRPGPGRGRHAAEGPQRARLAHQPRPAPARVVTSDAADQRHAERLEGVLDLVQRDDLEVRRVADGMGCRPRAALAVES